MEKVENVKIREIGGGDFIERLDLLAVEEPLEIRIIHGEPADRKEKKVAITMRTPGNDFELVIGFLFSEGVIENFEQIKRIRHCKKGKAEEEKGNVVIVDIDEKHTVDIKSIDRNFYTSSSCGVCGKSSLESIHYKCKAVSSNLTIIPETLNNAPQLMGNHQDVFKHTGGIHATALFNADGSLKMIREDVGRHNAMDKIVGSILSQNLTPTNKFFLVVSGRLSFELVQKAIAIRIPIIAAIGAPSSLAVKLAEEFNITLVGFLKKDRFNVYTHNWRIDED